jgi:hypothetical protein
MRSLDLPHTRNRVAVNVAGLDVVPMAEQDEVLPVPPLLVRHGRVEALPTYIGGLDVAQLGHEVRVLVDQWVIATIESAHVARVREQVPHRVRERLEAFDDLWHRPEFATADPTVRRRNLADP